MRKLSKSHTDVNLSLVMSRRNSLYEKEIHFYVYFPLGFLMAAHLKQLVVNGITCLKRSLNEQGPNLLPLKPETLFKIVLRSSFGLKLLNLEEGYVQTFLWQNSPQRKQLHHH